MFLKDRDSMSLALHVQNRGWEVACSMCFPGDDRQTIETALIRLDTFMRTLSDEQVLRSVHTGI